MATEFSPAPKEIISIAERLIGGPHRELEELSLGFIMRSEAAATKGVTVLAKVYKPPAWSAVLDLLYDYVVELPLDIWSQLVAHQREAMVDYALCMIRLEYDERKEKDVYWLTAPDVQGYRSNMERYGLWWPGAVDANSAFVKAAQISIPGLKPKGKLEAIGEKFVDEMGKLGREVSADIAEDGTPRIHLTPKPGGAK